MNSMDKIVFTFVEISVAVAASLNLISIGSDYRHWLAALVGSLLAVTRMGGTKSEKIINSAGGFSASSFISPAACEWFNVHPDSNKGVLIFFIVGYVSMLVLSILTDAINSTKGHVPGLVSTLMGSLKTKIKNLFGNGKTEQNEEDRPGGS